MITDFKKALSINPDDGRSHLILGMIFEAAIDRCLDQNKRESLLYEDRWVLESAHREYLLARVDNQITHMADSLLSRIDSIQFISQHGHYKGPKKGIPKWSKCYSWLKGWKQYFIKLFPPRRF